MREIKFRIWDTENKKWYKDWLGINNFGVVYYDDRGYGDLSLKDSVVIQQYIGLLDKNGCEIYEGDLVDFRYETYEKEWDGAKPGGEEVFFEDGIFYFGRELKFATNDCNFDIKSLEVVGNIFNN